MSQLKVSKENHQEGKCGTEIEEKAENIAFWWFICCVTDGWKPRCVVAVKGYKVSSNEGWKGKEHQYQRKTGESAAKSVWGETAHFFGSWVDLDLEWIWVLLTCLEKNLFWRRILSTSFNFHYPSIVTIYTMVKVWKSWRGEVEFEWNISMRWRNPYWSYLNTKKAFVSLECRQI